MAGSLQELETFLDKNRDSRESRRALAIRMSYKGYTYEEIGDILKVSIGSISLWKQAYEENGLEGLLLQYKGSKPYLTDKERAETIAWLQDQEYWSVERLKAHIETTYDVVFKSKQSYYELFDAADISWKRSQRANPAKDPKKVAAKKKRLLTS